LEKGKKLCHLKVFGNTCHACIPHCTKYNYHNI
jgi:hypothetical protein